MGSDVLRLKNMAFYAYHGLLAEEERLGQRYEVDLDIFGDFRGFSRDDGGRAVNYPDVYAAIEDVVTGERFELVESLADRIAEVLQAQFGIDRLAVRVRKPNPPVPGHFDGIEVEVRRGG
ncbi:MAG: dihydroneopterin aldolase [Candidatus Latescibacteria bacterium]|jgi:dihydroneopterin aldolase|nr:dihydroneopterin aldolase [Candidatus Latescibacterota bacterium]